MNSSPESGDSSPARHRARVDLPEPDFPTRANVDCAPTVRLTSSTATIRNLREGHRPRMYDLLTWRASSRETTPEYSGVMSREANAHFSERAQQDLSIRIIRARANLIEVSGFDDCSGVKDQNAFRKPGKE